MLEKCFGLQLLPFKFEANRTIGAVRRLWDILMFMRISLFHLLVKEEQAVE